MTGPTVEGSVLAKVQADISNFEENIARARAKLEELTGKKTDVTVGANTASAQAQLKALQDAVEKVSTAETRLAAAERASQNAASQSYIANLRLERELTRRGRTELSVAAATEASARADRNAEAAELRHAAATNVLTAAQVRLKAITDAVLADNALPNEPTAAGSSKTPNAGGGGPVSAVAVGIAVLVPLVAALAGYVAAVTGSFLGMGAAGVFAVLGIKNAIDAGTKSGDVFSSGLHLLKGDLDQLSNTAATAMLADFQRAVDMISSDMPSLNGEIRLFSGLLGTTGDIVLSTLISGFKTLLPLFLQAGVYVEQLAVGFQKWTTGGGLALWARDASVALPQVADAFGSLLHGVVSVLGALQPLGTVMLGTIGIVGNVLTLLSQLGPAFPIITAGALAAVGAFKLFNDVPPVVNLVSKAVTALGISTDVALGPIGWVAAGIAAIAAVALTATAATNNAAEAVDNYSAALQQDNGVIGEHTRAQVANNLQTSGALAIARELGISTKTLTEATLGNGYAQAGVAGKIKVLTAELKAMDQANARAAETTAGAQTQAAAKLADQLQKLTAEYAAQQKGVRDAWKAYNDIAAAQGLTTYKTQAQQAAVTALAATYGDSVGVYLGAKAAQKQTEDQLKATTAAMVQEDDAAGLLTNALTLLNGGSLSVAQAQTGLSAANNSLVDSFKQNGHAVDGSTKAAVANQQAIQQQVQAAQQAAEAIGKQTGSSEKAVQAYKDSKDAIEAQLKAQGDLTPAVQAYIDKLYAVADLKVPPTKLDVDDAAALKKLAEWQKAVAALSNNVSLHVTASGGVVFSDAKQRAGGGVTGLGELTLVGEKGPEYARFPTGTTIYPNGVKPAMSSTRITNNSTKMQSSTSTTQNHWYITETVNAESVVAAVQRRQNLSVA